MENFPLMPSWLAEIAKALSGMTIIEIFSFATGSLGVTVASLWTAIVSLFGWRSARRKWKEAKAHNANLAREIENSDRLLKEAEKAWARDAPQVWLQEADKLEREDQHERAHQVLRIGFENVRTNIAEVALRLAKFHIERSGLRPEEIGEARALSLIATELDNRSKTALRLLQEINEMTHAQSFALGRYNPNDQVWSEPAILLAEKNTSADLEALVRLSRDNIKSNRFYIALRLADFACRIARSTGISHTLNAFAAQNARARALFILGYIRQALEELESFESEEALLLGKTHSNVRSTLFLRIEVLYGAKRWSDMLECSSRLTTINKLIYGHAHFQTLQSMTFVCDALFNLGQRKKGQRLFGKIFRTALNSLNELEITDLQLHSKVSKMRAGAGDLEGALALATTAYALADRHIGPKGINTLANRYQYADILMQMGRAAESLKEIDAVLPIQEEILGPSNPLHTAPSRLMRIQLLNLLGRFEEALQDAEELNALNPEWDEECTRSLEINIQRALHGLRGQ